MRRFAAAAPNGAGGDPRPAEAPPASDEVHDAQMTAQARRNDARRHDGPFVVHVRVVIALLRREMTTRYGNSFGGYFWAVGEPVGMIFMLSMVFAALSRSPALGQHFIVFFATGQLVYTFYKNTADQLSRSLKNNKALLKYPNVTSYDALVARLLLNFLTNCMVTILVLGGAIILTGERVSLDFGLMLPAILSITVLGAGVGMCNAVLFPLYPLWERVFSILMRPLFLVSAIFYTPESMPRVAQEALSWNPIVHAVTTFREGVYPIYHAEVNHLEYPLVLGLVLIFTGLVLLRSKEQRLSEL